MSRQPNAHRQTNGDGEKHGAGRQPDVLEGKPRNLCTVALQELLHADTSANTLSS
jgi:hypothetical protein